MKLLGVPTKLPATDKTYVVYRKETVAVYYTARVKASSEAEAERKARDAGDWDFTDSDTIHDDIDVELEDE